MSGIKYGIIFSIIGSCIGGFGGALFWICYGAYTKSLCVMNQQQHLQGKYFGILGAITYSSSIFGPIITTFLLDFFSTKTYLIALFLIGITATLFGYLFIQDVDYTQESLKSDNYLEQLQNNVLYYKKMKVIIILLFLDGLTLGFISSSVSKILPQQAAKNSLIVGIFLIILGIGSALGSLISGYLSDIFEMKKVGKSAVVIIWASCIYSLIALKLPKIILSFFGAFLWGFALQYLQGWIYVVCSRNYNGHLQAFANSKQFHSFAFCLYQVYLIATKDENPVIFAIFAILLISLPSYLFLQKLPSSQKPQKETSRADAQIEQNF